MMDLCDFLLLLAQRYQNIIHLNGYQINFLSFILRPHYYKTFENYSQEYKRVWTV